MSGWDQYLENLASNSRDDKGTAHIDQACIISLDGGQKWNTDESKYAFKIDPKEGEAIAKCFKSKDFTPFQASGIRISGMKYNFLRADQDGTVAYGKMKDHGSVTMQASDKAVIICHCPEGCQPGVANSAASKIAHHLADSGY